MLKYFEKGHTCTYMSTDSKQKQIEKELKNMGKVYLFDDFKTCVSKGKCSHGHVLRARVKVWYEPMLKEEVGKMPIPCL